MRAKNKNKIYLINVLYILNLKINLLLDRRICQKNLYKDFDKHSIQMRNKQERRIFIANQQKDVYIINKIALNLNKITFIVVI